MESLSVLKNIVWGLPTVVLLTVFGVFFTHKSRFYSIKAIRSILRDLYLSLFREKREGISPLAAVATALGGTVGIGSIVGVGYALATGGAGSIFWMWVCSFFGMGLKYAEVKIALNRRRVGDGDTLGGAPFRLKDMGFARLAVAFCIICIIASFGTGNLTQINALSGVLVGKGIARPLCALICVVTIGIAVFGGRRRISRINLLLVPSASFIYLAACIFVIIANHSLLLEVLGRIFREAFGFSAMAHGISGAMISNALRVGFARSIFSNEAGMGSSPLAHATSSEQNPENQAKWGIFEIFFDSFLVSTLTAFALLLSKTASPEFMFSLHFGHIGELVFSVLTAVFAFASVISWCYYAECCLSFLFPRKSAPFLIYRAAFSLAAACGAFLSNSFIWETADVLNAFMMMPNLFLLYKCRNEIERIG